MKLWITKYAMSAPVMVKDCEIQDDPPTMAIFRAHQNKHYHKPHWHETKEEARAQFMKMKTAKIKSLERQLDKMKRLEFVCSGE